MLGVDGFEQKTLVLNNTHLQQHPSIKTAHYSDPVNTTINTFLPFSIGLYPTLAPAGRLEALRGRGDSHYH